MHKTSTVLNSICQSFLTSLCCPGNCISMCNVLGFYVCELKQAFTALSSNCTFVIIECGIEIKNKNYCTSTTTTITSTISKGHSALKVLILKVLIFRQYTVETELPSLVQIVNLGNDKTPLLSNVM